MNERMIKLASNAYVNKNLSVLRPKFDCSAVQ